MTLCFFSLQRRRVCYKVTPPGRVMGLSIYQMQFQIVLFFAQGECNSVVDQAVG
jgi:hypothetical protein